MGSSSSSYAPKTIYLDVDGKVQKVGSIIVESLFIYLIVFICQNTVHFPFLLKNAKCH